MMIKLIRGLVGIFNVGDENCFENSPTIWEEFCRVTGRDPADKSEVWTINACLDVIEANSNDED